jgi:hypothetical protein
VSQQRVEHLGVSTLVELVPHVEALRPQVAVELLDVRLEVFGYERKLGREVELDVWQRAALRPDRVVGSGDDRNGADGTMGDHRVAVPVPELAQEVRRPPTNRLHLPGCDPLQQAQQPCPRPDPLK